MPQDSITNGDCDIFVFDTSAKEWCKRNGVLYEQGGDVILGKSIGSMASSECQRLQKEKPPSLSLDIYGGDAVAPGDYPHMVNFFCNLT